jgi:hypothetical protein
LNMKGMWDSICHFLFRNFAFIYMSYSQPSLNVTSNSERMVIRHMCTHVYTYIYKVHGSRFKHIVYITW